MSVIGIGMGVMTMIVVLSVMNGFNEAIEERILKSMPHLVIKTDSVDQQKYILSLQPGFSSFSKQDVLMRTVEGIYSGAIAQGTDTASLEKLGMKIGQSVEIIENSKGMITTARPKEISPGVTLGKRELAMGYELARSLGVVEGDEVTMISPESLLTADEIPVYEKFNVRALLKTDVSELDSRYVFFNQNYFPSRFRDAASLEHGLEIRFKNPYKAFSVAQELQENGIKNIQTWQDLNQALFYSLKMEKRLMGIFLALTVLISSFSIMSVLYLMVAEKRKDVGILKAIGARNSQVSQIFIRLGLMIGLTGLALGTFAGLFVCFALIKYPIIKLPDVYIDTRFPILVDPKMIVGILLFSLAVTLLSSFFPAKWAASHNPTDTLRNN